MLNYCHLCMHRRGSPDCRESGRCQVSTSVREPEGCSAKQPWDAEVQRRVAGSADAVEAVHCGRSISGQNLVLETKFWKSVFLLR